MSAATLRGPWAQASLDALLRPDTPTRCQTHEIGIRAGFPRPVAGVGAVEPGAEPPHTSRDLPILVKQPVEPVTPSDWLVSLAVGWGMVVGERLGQGWGAADAAPRRSPWVGGTLTRTTVDSVVEAGDGVC